MLFVINAPVRRPVLRSTPLMVAPLLIVFLVYGPPYSRTRAEQGPRQPGEVQDFSATPADFVRVPPDNKLRGVPADRRPAPDERSLYPGTVALLLAGAAFWARDRRWPLVYGAMAAVSVDITLGLNGILLPAIQQAAPLVTSLRAPARFGVFVLLSVSVLAGFGAAACFRARPRWAPMILIMATAACLGEYWSAPVRVRPGLGTPTEAHLALSHRAAGSVILELPVPDPGALWLYETTYQLRSIHHWQPLVNGYSGFAPKEYVRTLELLRGFPDDASVARLRQLGVQFVLLNRPFYSGEQFTALVGALSSSPSFWPAQAYGRPEEQIVVVELKPAAP
jgi:hypothetical protein